MTEDKADVNARVAWYGVGVNLATNEPTREALRAAVRTVLVLGALIVVCWPSATRFGFTSPELAADGSQELDISDHPPAGVSA
jgi:hypothetical protein